MKYEYATDNFRLTLNISHKRPLDIDDIQYILNDIEHGLKPWLRRISKQYLAQFPEESL